MWSLEDANSLLWFIIFMNQFISSRLLNSMEIFITVNYAHIPTKSGL